MTTLAELADAADRCHRALMGIRLAHEYMARCGHPVDPPAPDTERHNPERTDQETS